MFVLEKDKTMKRKRRTVLWLYTEDYDYLNEIAENDMDSKNTSMHRLIKALRSAGIDSFQKLDRYLKKIEEEAKTS